MKHSSILPPIEIKQENADEDDDEVMFLEEIPPSQSRKQPKCIKTTTKPTTERSYLEGIFKFSFTCDCEYCVLVKEKIRWGREKQKTCRCEECLERRRLQPSNNEQQNVHLLASNQSAITQSVQGPPSLDISDAVESETSPQENLDENYDNNYYDCPTPDYVPFGDEDEEEEEENNSDLDEEQQVDGELNNDPSTSQSKCPKCPVVFANKTVLLRHYREKHLGLIPFYCRASGCDFTNGRLDRLKNHIERSHRTRNVNRFVGERPVRDDQLDDTYVALVNTTMPIRRRTTATRPQSQCPKCTRIIQTAFLQQHIESHRKIGYRCSWQNCGFFYTNRDAAQKHVEECHLSDRNQNAEGISNALSCLERIKPRKTPSNEEDEQSDSSENTSDSESEDNSYSSGDSSGSLTGDRFVCPRCDNELASLQSLQRHYRTHLGVKPYYCRFNTECTFVAVSSDQVLVHIRQIHRQGGAKSLRKYLGERQIRADEVDQFYIELCKNNKKESVILTENMRASTSTAIESQLPKSTFSSVGVAHNSDVEEDEYDSCSTPDHVPSSDDDESSEGEENEEVNATVANNGMHQCPNCSMKYTTRQSLQRHFRGTHLGLKPYYCNFVGCSYGYTAQRNDVIRHIQAKHCISEGVIQDIERYVGEQIVPPEMESVYRSIFEKRKKGRKRKHPMTTTTISPAPLANSAFSLPAPKPKMARVQCPQCDRVIGECYFQIHLDSHLKSGLRCIWDGCRFFSTNSDAVKKHVVADHFTDEHIAKRTEPVAFLVRIDPLV